VLEIEGSDPYSVFIYGMRSPKTKEKCIGRLRAFLDFIQIPGEGMTHRCKVFCEMINSNNTGWLLANIGSTLSELGNYSGAISFYKKALALDPHHTAAVFGIGWVLATLGNHPQAMIYYEFLKLNQQRQQQKEPYNVTFGLIERADILMHMGNYSQSLNIIQQVLKTHPTDDDALETAGALDLYLR
jgi:tetratricopeptide (TPR) repeat protein